MNGARPPEHAIDATILQEYRDMGSDGDDDFVAKLIDLYLEESTTHLAQVTDAVTRGDAAALRVAAHTLKGSSSAVGANTLAGICEALETLARVPGLDGAPTLVTALVEELARVREALGIERRIAG